MPSITTFLSFVIFIATSLAVPTHIQGASTSKNMGSFEKRDTTIWNNKDGGGDLTVSISDAKINWGTTPPWYALDEANKWCNGNGCDDFRVPTTWVHEGKVKTGDLVFRMDASYQTWARLGLVEVLKATSAKAYEFKKIKPDPVHYPSNGPTADTWIQDDPYDQYFATKRITLRVEGKDGGEVMNMEFKVCREINDQEMGICEQAMVWGQALGGTIHGGVGGVFTLGTLFCTPAGPNPNDGDC